MICTSGASGSGKGSWRRSRHWIFRAIARDLPHVGSSRASIWADHVSGLFLENAIFSIGKVKVSRLTDIARKVQLVEDNCVCKGCSCNLTHLAGSSRLRHLLYWTPDYLSHLHHLQEQKDKLRTAERGVSDSGHVSARMISGSGIYVSQLPGLPDRIRLRTPPIPPIPPVHQCTRSSHQSSYAVNVLQALGQS